MLGVRYYKLFIAIYTYGNYTQSVYYLRRTDVIVLYNSKNIFISTEMNVRKINVLTKVMNSDG